MIDLNYAGTVARVTAAAVGTVLCSAMPLVAQQVPDDEYLHFVPLEVPRLIRQTDASLELHLFGDRTAPDYEDAAPRDGIDDDRGRSLTSLAARFAPFLVQNSEMVPLDFRTFSDPGFLPLHVDTWDVSSESQLTSRDTIDWLGKTVPECTNADLQSADCRLVELLQAYDPERPSTAAERIGAESTDEVPFDVLYLNFPGAGAEAWKAAYRGMGRQLKSEYQDATATFVHPFLEQVDAPGGQALYQLVLQYWFFYPYNDGGNDHEGDWEHIHVIPSPVSLVERPGLEASDLVRMLDGAWPEADPIVIQRVEFYFHSKVAILDYSSPNVYQPRTEWDREVMSLADRRLGGKSWSDYIRWVAYEDDAETRVNTHPIGYIGADNKGLDQLLSHPGGTNHDSHGTYPRPGLYRDIGPAGATENVPHNFDHRKYFLASESERETLTSRFRRGFPVFLGSIDRIHLVPDWERVEELVFESRQARLDWAWLLLPIRWGFPAHRSPFAGVVAHAETGNLAIPGPAFNTGWNRSGPRGQYRLYVPHTLSRLFPTSVQGEFDNDWGYLNATLPMMTFLPPFDLLWRVGAAPLRALLTPLHATYYPNETLPHRFVGLKAGVSWQSLPDDYTDLLFNETQARPMIGRLLTHLIVAGADSATEVTNSSTFVENDASALFQVEFFVGKHLSSVNTLRHARSRLVSSSSFSNIDPFDVTADLNLWEYAGSLRYSILSSSIQPFLKGGYGLTWYRLENYSTNGELIDNPESPWIRRPSLLKFDNLLPNTWHFGAGLEALPVRNVGPLPGGLDLSFTLEWLLFTNKLGLDKVGVDIEDFILLGVPADKLPRERWVTRHTINALVTVSF